MSIVYPSVGFVHASAYQIRDENRAKFFHIRVSKSARSDASISKYQHRNYTSQVLLAGVPGGFPEGYPVFTPSYWLARLIWAEIILKGTLSWIKKYTEQKLNRRTYVLIWIYVYIFISLQIFSLLIRNFILGYWLNSVKAESFYNCIVTVKKEEWSCHFCRSWNRTWQIERMSSTQPTTTGLMLSFLRILFYVKLNCHRLFLTHYFLK